MPDPAGKSIYLVNGKSTGYLTAYNTRTKQYTDIAGENATQPVLSHKGNRVMYITAPSRDQNELWEYSWCDERMKSKTPPANSACGAPGSSFLTRGWSRQSATEFVLLFLPGL